MATAAFPSRWGATAARWALALGALYAALVAVSAGVWWLVAEARQLPVQPLPEAQRLAFTLSFITFFAPLLYLGCCLLARKVLATDWRTLLLYMGATFFCAFAIEIVVDTAFEWVLGRPAWVYHIWPVHHGYTSGVGVLMWPLYGLFVYYLHAALRENPALHFLDNNVAKGVLVGVDAMVLEVLANGFSLLGYQSFYFYYLAGDLQHFTTAEIFLPYVAAGLVGMQVLRLFHGLRHRAWIGAGLWALGAVLVLRVV